MPRTLTLDDLYALQVPSDPQLSPDAERVAFVVSQADRESDENRSSIWLAASSATGSPRAVTNGPRDASPRWRDSSHLLFLRRDDDGRPQVWELPLEGGEPVQRTSAAGGVGAYNVSPDGRQVAFTSVVDLDDDGDDKPRPTAPVVADRLGYKADGSGLLRGKRSHLFVVDLEPDTNHGNDGNGAARQLTEGNWSAGAPAWSPTGDRLAFAAARHDDRDINPGSSIFVVDLDGGEPVQLTPLSGSAGGPVWLDGTTLLFAGKRDATPGHSRLMTVPVAGGEPTELAPDFDRNVMLGAPAYPGSLPRLTGDGMVLFCARDRGCTHIYCVPQRGGVPDRFAGVADTVASSISVSGDRMAYLRATPASPGEVVVVETDGAGERVLTNFARALDDVEIVVPQERTFTAPDGTEIHGWILKAAESKERTPLLIDIHGGPHNAWSPVFDPMHLYHHALVATGWTVLTLNPRGSDGYGEEFYTAVVSGWGTADLHDFLAPIDALVTEGIVDPSRLAVTGYSYGGYMTCWLTSRTDRFAAAIAGGSVTNLHSLFGTSDLGWYLGQLEIGASPVTDAKRLLDHSPITYAGDVATPTLILHGENDDRCPVEQAEQWFAALRSQRVPTQLVRYPGASHLFVALGRPSHRIDYGERVIAWLAEHVASSFSRQ